MVTISFKESDLFAISEAIYEYGMSIQVLRIGNLAIKMLEKIKKTFSKRSDKLIFDQWIGKIRKFQGIDITVYSKK